MHSSRAGCEAASTCPQLPSAHSPNPPRLPALPAAAGTAAGVAEKAMQAGMVAAQLAANATMAGMAIPVRITAGVVQVSRERCAAVRRPADSIGNPSLAQLAAGKFLPEHR